MEITIQRSIYIILTILVATGFIVNVILSFLEKGNTNLTQRDNNDGAIVAVSGFTLIFIIVAFIIKFYDLNIIDKIVYFCLLMLITITICLLVSVVISGETSVSKRDTIAVTVATLNIIGTVLSLILILFLKLTPAIGGAFGKKRHSRS